MESASIFHHLKPVCVPLVKNGSKNNLERFLIKIGSLPSHSILEKPLFEYALFPFKLILRQTGLSENEEILYFECLDSLFKKCSKDVVNLETVLWIFNIFSIYFTPKEAFQQKSNNNTKSDVLFQSVNKSDEQKIATLTMLESILRIIELELFEFVYQDIKNLPLVGHVISIVLKFVETERNKDLLVKSVSCLHLLCGQFLESKIVADTVSSFFPGIALTLNTFFTSNSKQSTKLLIPTLEMFGDVTCLVMNDNDKPKPKKLTLDTLKLAFQDAMQTTKQDEPSVNDNKETLLTQRDSKWYETTSTHIQTILQNVLPVIMMHDNVKTRLVVIDFVELLLLNCRIALKSSIPSMLDTLAKFLSDPYKSVQHKSKQVLTASTKYLMKNGDFELNSSLQKRLHSLFLSLPRVMNSASEDTKLAHLNIIKGYLIIFGASFENFLCSPSHSKTLFSALIQVLEFNVNDIALVEERVQKQYLPISKDESDDYNASKYHVNKRFRFFNSQSIHDELIEIIHLMVANGSVDIVVDYLLVDCIENHQWKMQTCFILNEVVRACQKIEGFDAEPYVGQISTTYLQDHLWRLPESNEYLHFIQKNEQQHVRPKHLTFESLSLTGTDLHQSESLLLDRSEIPDSHNVTLPVETLNHNIQSVCLLLEGFSAHAYALKGNYNVYLVQTLYPILEKVGSSNATIHSTAMNVLNDISRYCNYESVSDLILINSDYLINSVTLQFRRIVLGSAAPAVLAVVLKLCDREIMPVVCDATADVFRLLDVYQEDIAGSMLEVLNQFAMSVDRWFCVDDTDSVGSGSSKQEKSIDAEKELMLTDVANDKVSVGDFLSEYSGLLIQSHGKVSEDDIEDNLDDDCAEDDHEEEEEEEEEHKVDSEQKIPFHFEILIKALERCTYYNSAHSKSIQLKSFDVTQHCVLALRRRENDLLPALHKVWPSVIVALKSKDMVVVMKCLEVVTYMVQHSGDFLRKRLTTEFLSGAIDFLVEHRENFSKGKSRFTQVHKALNRLILFLGDTIINLEIGLKDFCRVVECCIYFLNCKLHESIQKAALKTLTRFYKERPGVVWLILNSFSAQESIIPPNPVFPKLKYRGNASVRNIYTDNINKIYLQVS